MTVLDHGTEPSARRGTARCVQVLGPDRWDTFLRSRTYAGRTEWKMTADRYERCADGSLDVYLGDFLVASLAPGQWACVAVQQWDGA